jgi:glycosyltransferase involved in cell wall biosynthesis
VKIAHHMKLEKSGLAFTTLEIVKAEQEQGHEVVIRQPDDAVMYGGFDGPPDVHVIHSQICPKYYHDKIPKFLLLHGEALSSVGNGVSMRAIVDLAPICEAFIAMRPEEWSSWASIKRTYVVRKGLDLARFRPMDVPAHDPKNPVSKLSGSPAILYAEHWRGQRNPLFPILAAERVHQRYPDARLHLFNCTDPKMQRTFSSLVSYCKFDTFVRSILGPVPDADVPLLYNRSDVVVSGLFPLYARSLEAFGCGKPFVGAGYRDSAYPFRCDFTPESMAEAICAAWEGRDTFNARAWAEAKHNVHDTVREMIAIFQRYLA